MGGLLALAYSQERPERFKSLIMSSPAMGLYKQPNVLKVFFGRLLSHLIPAYTLSNGLDLSGISRDVKVVQDYKLDPLNHDRISLYTGRVLLDLQKRFRKASRVISVPILLVHGTDDRLTSFAASKRFFRLLGGEGHRIVTIDGGFHERKSIIIFIFIVHFDLCADQVFDIYIKWIIME